MTKYNIKDFIRGWIIGDFEPSLIKTKNFEITVKNFIAGEEEEKHVHKLADEYTVVLSGHISMNDVVYKEDDIVVIEKGEASKFKSITDSKVLGIKVPSVIGDKYIVE